MQTNLDFSCGRRTRLSGLALTELLLAVALVSALVTVSVSLYSSARATLRADDQAQRMIELGADIRRIGKAAGSYTGMSAARAADLGLVQSPLRLSGGTVYDAWGNPMTIFGNGPWLFALTAGGTTTPITAAECAAIATRLADVAYRVQVGTATAVATSGVNSGWVLGGVGYREGPVLDQSGLTTGCAQANPVVGATFLER